MACSQVFRMVCPTDGSSSGLASTISSSLTRRAFRVASPPSMHETR